MKDLEALFARIAEAHATGNADEALKNYADILVCEADNPDALSVIAIMYAELGLSDQALQIAGRAHGVSPAGYMSNMALGLALQGTGALSDAVEAYQAALAVQADDAPLLNNLATTLNDLERYDDAVRYCLQGIDVAPDMAALYNNLGVAFTGKGQARPAEMNFRKAIASEPEFADAYYNLGTLLSDSGRFDEALVNLEAAVAKAPQNLRFVYNLANTYRELGDFERAVRAYEAILSRAPDSIDAIVNLSTSLASLGKLTAAEQLVLSALKEAPDCAELHWNLALIYLQQGKYRAGWSEYEWRWRWDGFTSPVRDFEKPQWDGTFAPGKTILVHCEQGFGDNIQFSRYIPLLIAKGMKVIVEARPELRRLFEGFDGVECVVDWGAPVPDYDMHCPMLSLPMCFGTTMDTVPAAVPYIKAHGPVDARTGGDGLKVGLMCAGSKTRHLDRFRSIDFGVLAPLLSAEGVRFFSLDVGAAPEDIPEGVTDLGASFADFADTAAAMAGLDLVISVDTSVLHLAGAMGKPAWGLLSEPAGFLWMKEVTESPWYPTVRLYRKGARDPWDGVIEAMRTDLEGLKSGA